MPKDIASGIATVEETNPATKSDEVDRESILFTTGLGR
jgi:hypothetical protein